MEEDSPISIKKVELANRGLPRIEEGPPSSIIKVELANGSYLERKRTLPDI